ncbi:hypothetical protein Tco_0787705 [Tanacetum coccineum]
MEIDRRFEEMLRPLETNSPVGEPEGSDDYTGVPFDDEQILRHHNTAHMTPPPLAYTPIPPVLATMEPLDTFLIGDECDMPVNTPLPTTDVRDEDFDINSPLGEQVVDSLMENEDVAGLPRHLVKRLFSHLLKNPSLTKGMSDEPLGDDSKPRSYDFEDISNLDPPVSTPVIDESSLLVTPLPDPKQICLRELERFNPFFSLTQSGGTTRVMETPSFGFHHMSSPRPAAYSLGGDVLLNYHP